MPAKYPQALRMMSMQMTEDILEWLEQESKAQRRTKVEIVRSILLDHMHAAEPLTCAKEVSYANHE